MATAIRLTSTGTCYLGVTLDEITQSTISVTATTLYSSEFDEVTYNNSGGTGQIGFNGVSTSVNKLNYSQDFTNWSKNASPNDYTVSADSTAAPDGSTTADLIIKSTGVGSSSVCYKLFTGAISTAYCGSIYLKAGGYSKVQVVFSNTAFNSTNYGGTFDLAAGTTNTILNGSTVTITSVENGWYRITVTATSDADGGNYVFAITLLDASYSANFAGDGTSGIYFWGAQVELGSAATAYVATGATTSININNFAQRTLPSGRYQIANEFVEQSMNSATFTTVGSTPWVVPTGVTTIYAVAVGGGGGSAWSGITLAATGAGGGGGGGGGLRWINNLTVTPGETLTIVVGSGGAGGTAAGGYSGSAGGNTSILRGATVLVQAGGGGGGTWAGVAGNSAGVGGAGGTGTTTGAGPVSGTVGGANGGAGGSQAINAGGGGGGGAGGYLGNGGTGGAGNVANNTLAAAGSGGAGGGGGSNLTTGINGGGGVGLNGLGFTGGSATQATDTAGQGGSGGATATSRAGALYGGGGAAQEDDTTQDGSAGAQGAVKIVWDINNLGIGQYPYPPLI